jgi:hypothetical protein
MNSTFLIIASALALAGAAHAQTDQPPASVDVRGVAETPLEDLNVKRSDIPAVLLKAEDAVYAPPKSRSCASIRVAVAELDEVLGDDFDVPALDTPEARKDKKTAQTNGVLKDAAGGVIPFRGWVRRLSGAAQHAEAVQRAISAGRVRRGYLKGLGQSLRCPPPAAPLGTVQAKVGSDQASEGA